MDVLWSTMMISAVLYGACTGNLDHLTQELLSSAKEAVQLGISMAGVMAFWMGLMEIAGESGMIRAFEKAMSPVITFLFPEIPRNHRAREWISMNMIANLLGLGSAATPAGLEAMKELQKMNLEQCEKLGETKRRAPHIASASMCTFLIINVSSLQLIPMNMIAYRAQYGSLQPAAITGPALLATAASTAAAVVFCKVMNCLGNRK